MGDGSLTGNESYSCQTIGLNVWTLLYSRVNGIRPGQNYKTNPLEHLQDS